MKLEEFLVKNIISKIKLFIKLTWYYIETRYTKILNLFGIKKDISIIPHGLYCYAWDYEKNKKQSCTDGYWIKTCKYYRSTLETKGIACTYEGYYGFDPCLYDQCKICSINDELDDDII